MVKQIWTEEEKASKKIADVISDLRLDAKRVGDALGTSQPVQVLNRIVEMVDGMYESRERFRRALGEASTENTPLPKIDDGNYDVDEATPFLTRCEILSELYTEYKEDERFLDLIKYADIAYPASYMISSGMIAPNAQLAGFINEAWDALLENLELEDEIFYDLSEIVDEYEDEDWDLEEE